MRSDQFLVKAVCQAFMCSVVGTLWVCIAALTGYFASWLFQAAFDEALTILLDRPVRMSMVQAGVVIGMVTLPIGLRPIWGSN